MTMFAKPSPHRLHSTAHILYQAREGQLLDYEEYKRLNS